jgi:methylated-DNA-[protein]-cysteine S-methyltransferase
MDLKLDKVYSRKIIQSPLGEILLVASIDKLISIKFVDTESADVQVLEIKSIYNENPVIEETEKQLKEYFNKERHAFDLPLEKSGSLFQNEVWDMLKLIPFGQTISYKKLAENLGNPLKIRAAATANGKNPFMIIVPCHRVIGNTGILVGYAGGLDRKRWLILHEQSNNQEKGLLF